MISEEEAEKALMFLKGSDAEAAKAKAYVELLDDQKKTILADQYMKATASAATESIKITESQKDKMAEASDAYKDHIRKLHDARYDWERARNLRKSAELQIEMWRSQNANMRRGNP